MLIELRSQSPSQGRPSKADLIASIAKCRKEVEECVREATTSWSEDKSDLYHQCEVLEVQLTNVLLEVDDDLEQRRAVQDLGRKLAKAKAMCM